MNLPDYAYFAIPLAAAAVLMKKGKPILAVGALAALTAVAPKQAWWGLGWKIPLPVEDFELDEVRGGPRLSLAENRGRPVVLFLWATWCPHTSEYAPLMRALTQKFEGSHVRFAAVDYEQVSRDKLLEFLKANDFSFPVYDGWTTDFPLWKHATFMPTVLFIDRKGRLNDVFHGTTREELEKKIRDVAFDGSEESRLPLAELLRRNGAAPAPAASADPATLDGKEAWAAEGAQAEALLLAGRLDELETKAAELRASRSRFSDGNYKLAKFYDGLALTGWETAEGADPYPDRIRLLQAWAAAKPASVTARTALAKCLFWWAWRARGSDPGVKDAAGFAQRLAQSHEEAEKALLLADKDPELFRTRLALGKGLGLSRPDMEKLLAEALAYDPAYERFYQAMGAYLAPRWFGAAGEWEAFAQQASEQRKDPALYALIVDDDSNVYEDDLFKDTRVSWPRLRDSLGELQKRYPGSLYRQSRFARYACEAGDKETARPLLTALGARYDREAWSSWNGWERYQRCKTWADGGALSDAALAVRRLIK